MVKHSRYVDEAYFKLSRNARHKLIKNYFSFRQRMSGYENRKVKFSGEIKIIKLPNFLIQHVIIGNVDFGHLWVSKLDFATEFKNLKVGDIMCANGIVYPYYTEKMHSNKIYGKKYSIRDIAVISINDPDTIIKNNSYRMDYKFESSIYGNRYSLGS